MRAALFVILGAVLWATDTIFRHPLSQQFSSVLIVGVEHLFAFVFSAIAIGASTRDFKPQGQLSGLFAIGVLGSATATVFFTGSFLFLNPSVAILIQKIQPILVMTFSALFLREKLPRFFWPFAATALFCAYQLSFPDGFAWKSFLSADNRGIFLAFGAAFFWSASTVVGKTVLGKISPTVVSFYRFGFGLLALTTWCVLSKSVRIEFPFLLANLNIVGSIAVMAFISGFLGVGLYYQGLAKVPASLATVLELSFPVAAVVINWIFLDQPLTRPQIFWSVALLISLLALGFAMNRKPAKR